VERLARLGLYGWHFGIVLLLLLLLLLQMILAVGMAVLVLGMAVKVAKVATRSILTVTISIIVINHIIERRWKIFMVATVAETVLTALVTAAAVTKSL
jgi:hypothetical protein